MSENEDDNVVNLDVYRITEDDREIIAGIQRGRGRAEAFEEGADPMPEIDSPIEWIMSMYAKESVTRSALTDTIYVLDRWFKDNIDALQDADIELPVCVDPDKARSQPKRH